MHVSEIYDSYNHTFDLKRSGRQYSPLLRVFVVVSASAAFAFVVPAGLGSFLGSLIAAQAILVGFTFNVAFFISSQARPPIEKTSTLEQQAAAERLSGATKDLFHIVTYYNVVTILSLMPALALLIPDVPSAIFQLAEPAIAHGAQRALNVTHAFSYVGFYGLVFGCAVLTCESGIAFARAISRVSYVFDERVRLLNH